MAEARSGVRPLPTVGRVGFEVDTGRKEVQLNIDRNGLVLYVPHPKFLARNALKRVRRWYGKAVNVCVPFPPWAAPLLVAGVAAWVVRSPATTWQRSGVLAHALWTIDRWSPITKLVESAIGGPHNLSTPFRVGYLAAYFTAGCSVAITVSHRFFLRHLLNYHGWLSEGHGKKKSLQTTIWGFLMKYVFVRDGKAGGTYVYQDILPTLPVPELEDTVDRYVTSMIPLLDEVEIKDLKQMATDFKQKEGKTLQWWLKLKWWTSSNYLSEWWLNFVYLRGRDPLPINSNWYGMISEKYRPTNDRAARGASVAHSFMTISHSIANETFQPFVISGIAPLCMAQYENAFSLTRIPGREQDHLEKAESGESKHIVVIYQGRFYKVHTYSPKTNNLLSPLQLYDALKGILDSNDTAYEDEAGLPALTTMNRTEWAEIRHNHFMMDAYNKERLEIIEKAVFTLCFDDDVPTDLSSESKRLLCGTGRSFWCDKSVNLVVNGTCQAGIHVEHSWGDAPVLSHVFEASNNKEISRTNYNDDGSIKATKEDLAKQKAGCFTVYPAERIRFKISPELEAIIAKAEVDHLARAGKVDFKTLSFGHYGKDVPKKGRCSPDSWIQMAFQLAYFRDQGRFDQTYEASMTRLFGLGRTETIRSASDDSATFVKVMEDAQSSKADKLAALTKACSYHQRLAQDAMIGKGCDRHLFGLYVVSVGKAIDSPFLKFALGRKWKLSTSQTPNCQTGKDNKMVLDEEYYKTANGGFGPVADDGYGISYVVYGKSFYFNISSITTDSTGAATTTGASKMADRVEQALLEMADLIR